MKQWLRANFLYSLALLMISTMVFGLYISLAAQNHFSQLEPMIDGTASRPYVYRVLTPIAVRVLSNTLNISPFLGAVFIMYLSMIGFSWSVLALAKVFLPQQYFQPFTLLAPIGLIPFLLEQRHIYDLPTLFLFTLALFFLAKNDFGKYILIFILATLSKETSLFLVVFFAIQFRKIERRKFLFLLFVQIIVYILVRLTLIMLFKNNPGSLLEFHLYDHINAYLQHPADAIILFSVIISIIGISAFFSMDKSNFVRNSLIAIGSPTLLLYFFFGVPFEVRVFLESYPSIFLTISFMMILFINRFTNVKGSKTVD